MCRATLPDPPKRTMFETMFIKSIVPEQSVVENVIDRL